MKSVLTSLAVLGFSILPVKGTVLTFDVSGLGAGVDLPQGYGDRVTATTMGTFSYGAAGGFTPNIEVSYAPLSGGNLQFWTTGYSELVNVVENEFDGDNGWLITIKADAGFFVQLSGFDLGNFGADVVLPGITVTDGNGNTLETRSNISIPSPGNGNHVDVDFNTPLAANTLVIAINTTGLGGQSDNIGVDNILFGQIVAIPEPGLCALFGLAGLLGVRRRW